jgi:hypothetical protein
MCKKMTYLMSLAVILASAGLVSAATVVWDNGGADALWSTPENWDPNGLPVAEDEVRLYLADANCVIDDSVAAVCQTLISGTASQEWCNLDMTGGTLTLSGNFQIGQNRDGKGRFIMSGGEATTTGGRLWVGMNGTGEFIMRDGVLNIYEKVEIGKNASGNGAVYMEGGVMNFTGSSTDLEIGSYGHGLLQMTGGVINVQDRITLAQGSTTVSTGVGRIKLYGGTIRASKMRPAEEAIYGTPAIDITEGVLIFNTDRRAIVNDYIERGWLVAYDSNGVVDVTWTSDPNQTTVTGRRLPPELAWGPTPKNRSTVSRPVILKWEPGIYAAARNVYFGTDFNDVNQATVDDSRGVLVSPAQPGTTFDLGKLTLGETYYWRIDEVNDANSASPWRGVVYRFTVADYIVVDDFESYNDIPDGEPGSHLIYKTWLDGWDNETANGAIIGYDSPSAESWMEKNTVHGGLQSVPVQYNVTVAPMAEVSVNPADLPVGTNWTGDNLATLSLWFRGGQFNGGANMYVKLNDGTPPQQRSDLQTPSWVEWTIPLADFKTDLSAGTVLFDDVRLYPPASPQ